MKIVPRVLRSITVSLGLRLLLGSAHRTLALQADGGNKTLDVGAFGDCLALLLELAGNYVLPYVVVL